MSYKLIISDNAKTDLKDIFEYLAYKLHVPEAGKKILQQLVKKIYALADMPTMYRVYPDEPLKSKKIRYFPVSKYVVFYTILEDTNSVYINRIIYGGRDIAEQSIDVIED